MPYQDSSLATRLKEAPEGHRGYATPGVKYGKGGTPKPQHRPAVVSDRDIDRRIGNENGQARGDKYPYRDNEVPSGLSKKYKPFATRMRDERMRKLLNAKREMVNRADNVEFGIASTGLSNLLEVFEFAMKLPLRPKPRPRMVIQGERREKFIRHAERRGFKGRAAEIEGENLYRSFNQKHGIKHHTGNFNKYLYDAS